MTPSLVIGGRGLIGAALVTHLHGCGLPLRWTSRQRDGADERPDGRSHYLDLLSPDPRLPELDGFWAVYLVAGVSGRERCASDPDTWRVNADAPRSLARQAWEHGWPIVFVSTGYVELDPLCAYAQQKIAVENVVLALGGAVVRPRGRVTQATASIFAEYMTRVVGRLGLHWWEGE